MKAHQRRALEAGLSEFDRIVTRRKLLRRSATAAAIMLLLGTSGWLLTPRWQQQPSLLPAYVELIHTPAQLGEELALAEACERVGSEGSRIYLVECIPGSRR